MHIKDFARNPDRLRLTWDDGHVNEFHYIWLRDNCRCSTCRHPKAGERTLDSLTIRLDIAPAEVRLDDSRALTIVWQNDGHETVFDPAWLHEHSYEPEELSARRFRPTLWDASLASAMPEVTYDSVMTGDAGLLAWLRLMRRYGVAIVRGTPTVPGEVGRLAERIAFLRPSNFGTIFDVQSKPDPNSVAYTALELKAHTDLVSREVQPGLQFLHCLVFEAAGGDSLVVDGFRAADVLRQRSAESFALLTSTPAPFRYQDKDTDLQFRSPMIRLDAEGELYEIRYNNALLAPLDVAPEIVKPFYEAYFRFVAVLRDPALEARRRLVPGDVLVVNNPGCCTDGRPSTRKAARGISRAAMWIGMTLMSRWRILERRLAN